MKILSVHMSKGKVCVALRRLLNTKEGKKKERCDALKLCKSCREIRGSTFCSTATVLRAERSHVLSHDRGGR